MKSLGFYVYSESRELWLADDEKHWTNKISEAALFVHADRAQTIGLRECDEDAEVFFVLQGFAPRESA